MPLAQAVEETARVQAVVHAASAFDRMRGLRSPRGARSPGRRYRALADVPRGARPRARARAPRTHVRGRAALSRIRADQAASETCLRTQRPRDRACAFDDRVTLHATFGAVTRYARRFHK